MHEKSTGFQARQRLLKYVFYLPWGESCHTLHASFMEIDRKVTDAN